MPPQVKRPLLLFAAMVFIFAVARDFLVPASYGKLGHFRADSMGEQAGNPPAHAGQSACAACHEDIAKAKSLSKHQGLACETCHGPAQDHVDDPGGVKPVKPKSREWCLTCHARNDSRPTWFAQVDGEIHGQGKSCLACHHPHHPEKGRRAK
jgi:hypothetical protein